MWPFETNLNQAIKTNFLNSVKILFSLFMLLIGLYCFSFYFQRGIFFAKNRPDRMDLSVYYNVAQILKEGSGHKLYNYDFQKQHNKKLFQQYLKGEQKDKVAQKSKPHFTPEDLKVLKSKKVEAGYFYYSPQVLPFLFLLSPLSVMALYSFINFFTFLVLGIIIYLSVKDKKFPTELILLFISSILLFQPFLHNFFHSQISFLICSCFFFYYFFHNRKQAIFSGLFLALALIKPQLGLCLLLLSFLKRDYKAIKFFCFYTFLFLLFSFPLLGFEGFKDYLFSLLSLTKFANINSFVNVSVPLPVEPVYPLEDMFFSFGRFANNCSVNAIQLVRSLTFILSLVAIFLIYFFLKPGKNNEEPIKFAIASLLSLFIFQYHHVHDYNLILIAILIASLSEREAAKNCILWFIVVCSLLTFLLDVNFGASNLINHYHFHSFWLLNILTILFLYIQLKLVSQVAPQINSQGKVINQ